MGSWLNELLIDSANEISNDVLNFIFGIISQVFGSARMVIGYSEVNALQAVSNVLASSFLILVTMKQIMNVHILEIDGDGDSSVLVLVEKACIALACIQMQNLLLTFLLNLAEKILEEASGSLYVEYTSISDMTNVIHTVCTNRIIVMIITIIYMIGFGMFLWKGVQRAAELIFMKVLFPLFCCDIVTVSMERFRSFFVAYMITIFGYIVQILAFKMSAVFLYAGTQIGIFISLALIFFAASAPNWLSKYMYSTGIGKIATNGARGVMNMIPQLMRMAR